MHLFLTILAAVMTFTVESKKEVSATGEFPYDMEVAYACTYQKGTVRDGDTATLSLSHLEGVAVQAVEVYIRSNKTAGAGVLTVSVNGAQVARKEGSFRDWTGAYDSETYHAISALPALQNHVNELQIRLVGTTNSLYIEKYVITYRPPLPCTVTLMDANSVQTTLTEASGMAGVVLPGLADREGWTFVGWTPTECWNIDFLPEWYAAGAVYRPSRDTTLWALWRMQETEPTDYATDLHTGEYLYCETTQLYAMSGTPEEGVAGTAIIDPSDEEQVYVVTFDEARQTATIRHKATNTYIGYSGTQLAATPSTWQVWHGGDKTCFYATISGKIYALLPKLTDGYGEYFFAGLIKTTETALSTATTALLPVPDEPNKPTYTCHPEVGLGIDIVEQTDEPQAETVIHLGNYQLIIRNGKKQIRL